MLFFTHLLKITKFFKIIKNFNYEILYGLSSNLTNDGENLYCFYTLLISIKRFAKKHV